MYRTVITSLGLSRTRQSPVRCTYRRQKGERMRRLGWPLSLEALLLAQLMQLLYRVVYLAKSGMLTKLDRLVYGETGHRTWTAKRRLGKKERVPCGKLRVDDMVDRSSQTPHVCQKVQISSHHKLFLDVNLPNPTLTRKCHDSVTFPRLQCFI